MEHDNIHGPLVPGTLLLQQHLWSRTFSRVAKSAEDRLQEKVLPFLGPTKSH